MNLFLACEKKFQPINKPFKLTAQMEILSIILIDIISQIFFNVSVRYNIGSSNLFIELNWCFVYIYKRIYTISNSKNAKCWYWVRIDHIATSKNEYFWKLWKDIKMKRGAFRWDFSSISMHHSWSNGLGWLFDLILRE